MSDKTDRIIPLLKPFGFTDEQARVYLYLTTQNEASALVISRNLKISRTKVYGILDTLIEMGLAGVTGEKNARRFFAQTHKQFEAIVNKKKSEAEMLESSLPSLFEQLSSIELAKATGSKIVNYRGIDGLKTVTWNSTRARGELRIFELVQDMSAYMDFDFSERARIEFAKHLKILKQITNIPKFGAFTNITELLDIWECRYVDPKELKMSAEIVIYNDVVAMYRVQDKEPFCVEIYNSNLSQMMKSLFDFVWTRARKMKILDARGAAKVIPSAPGAP